MHVRRTITAALVATSALAADIQAERLALINKLTAAGVFYKLEKPASLCHLWTGPRFAALPFDQNESFVNVVYAYCVTGDPAAKIIILKDHLTGNRIGEYSAYSGGLRLK